MIFSSFIIVVCNLLYLELDSFVRMWEYTVQKRNCCKDIYIFFSLINYIWYFEIDQAKEIREVKGGVVWFCWVYVFPCVIREVTSWRVSIIGDYPGISVSLYIWLDSVYIIIFFFQTSVHRHNAFIYILLFEFFCLVLHYILDIVQNSICPLFPSFNLRLQFISKIWNVSD